MTQRTDGDEEGFLIDCKIYTQIQKLIVFEEKPWPIHVPAAAVIHEWRALSVIIGRKGCVGG